MLETVAAVIASHKKTLKRFNGDTKEHSYGKKDSTRVGSENYR